MDTNIDSVLNAFMAIIFRSNDLADRIYTFKISFDEINTTYLR